MLPLETEPWSLTALREKLVKIGAMKGRVVIYRTSLGSPSPGVANCATVAGNRGEPSGESR